jgi:hypothetical protein
MYFLKRLAFPLDLRQYTDADTAHRLHGLGAVFHAHGHVEHQITFHPPTAIDLVHDALLHQHRTVEIRGHSPVLSAGNEKKNMTPVFQGKKQRTRDSVCFSLPWSSRKHCAAVRAPGAWLRTTRALRLTCHRDYPL